MHIAYALYCSSKKKLILVTLIPALNRLGTTRAFRSLLIRTAGYTLSRSIWTPARVCATVSERMACCLTLTWFAPNCAYMILFGYWRHKSQFSLHSWQSVSPRLLSSLSITSKNNNWFGNCVLSHNSHMVVPSTASSTMCQELRTLRQVDVRYRT